jgi:hypothetical protein
VTRHRLIDARNDASHAQGSMSHSESIGCTGRSVTSGRPALSRQRQTSILVAPMHPLELKERTSLTHSAGASSLTCRPSGKTNCPMTRSLSPNRSIATSLSLLIIAALVLFASTTYAPAQKPNPLAIVVAQRDAAIRQRDALLLERNAFRKVCRVHGWTEGDAVTWLAEVLPGGSERHEWAKWFERDTQENNGP